mgnify:CR=1 FL=1
MSGNSEKSGADRLVQAYNKMLEMVHDGVGQFEENALPVLRKRVDEAREKIVEMGELTREEADKLSVYFERDMQDAAGFLAETGDEFVSWLRTDITLIEAKLLDMLTQVADQTSLQLHRMADEAGRMPYRTGEVTGPGTLVCKGCKEELNFNTAARIPTCPKCQGKVFLRAHH